MAIDKLLICDIPAGHIYFVVWNASRQILDWSDHVFKAPGSVTTLALAATEDTNGGGVSESAFYADLDLSYLNSTPAIGAFFVDAYRRAEGSPSLAADLLLHTAQLKVAGGRIVAEGAVGDIPPGYVVTPGMNVTSTAGDHVQVYASVSYNGQPITLGDDDTCVFDCFEFSTGLSQFAGGTDPVGPADSNQFETTVDNPNFNDDVAYRLKATVVVSGVTLYGEETFPVIGSA